MAKRVITNKSVAPYYDDYDSSKQYTHLLAIPGRVAQAREITQIQSVVKDIVKSIGDSILKDGNIIEGCQVIVDSTKTRVTVTAGKLYIHGMVLPVEETTVFITGKGTETIGAKLVDYLITEVEDPTLKDPAQGYDNFNQPGCHRIQSQVAIVVNDPSSAIISLLIDGEVSVERYAPEYDTLTQTLARRTYDESGSYIVEGLNVRTEETLRQDKYNIVIEAGKSYVLGYELKIPTARRILANKAITFSPVVARRTYSSSGSQEYVLYSDHPYIKEILKVVGVKEVTEQYTISTNVDSVPLQQKDVYRLKSIRQGDNTYTIGTSSSDGDCFLDQSGTTYYIKWNGTNNYPAPNVAFNVTYEYYKVYEAGTDYELTITSEGHALRWVGDTPEDDTVFTVDFLQYLARKDVVYMDKYGSIAVLEGIPAEYNQDVAPEAPLNTLTLAIINNPPNGSVYVAPQSEAIVVNNIGLTRFTMSDIQTLLNRLKTMEYDQAVLALNDEARNDATANKRGIFTDPLIDLSHIDLYFNKQNSGAIIDPNKPAFDMALDLTSNICYLPINTRTSEVRYDETSSSKLGGRLITLSTAGENVVLSQMNATKSFLINPYSVFPQLPEVSVTPSVDSWIDDNIIHVPVSIQDSAVVSMSTRTIDNRQGWQINDRNYASRTSSSTVDTAIGVRTTTSTSDDIISERAITYIRRRQLTVEGYDFPSNLDNIKGYFDGVLVPLSPIDGTEAGTESGTVKSNDEGYLKATFMIPENILTGTREVLLKSDTVRDGYQSEGFTLYIAQGTSRTIQRTVTTLTTVLLQRTTTNTISSVYVDPVGQTFVLDRMTMIKGIDLYFESKPSINTPVVCEIREVNNGTITSQIHAHKSLSPDQVNVSSNGSVATRFNFDDPVLLEENKEYAFVVRSTSDAYTVWVSELGGIDVATNTPVLKNSYMTGVMLSSSNNSTWTAHQTTDLKFRLIEDVYDISSTVQFNEISASEFSRVYLSADSAIPSGTTVSWSYSLDGTNYETIAPYNIMNLSSMNTAISIRATMSREGSINLSPMIALDTISVTTSCYDTKGYYVSRNITGLSAYTKVKIVIDTYEPSGTNIAVKVSHNNGTTVLDAVKESSTSLSFGWQESTYTVTVPSSTSCRIFIGATSVSKAVTPAFRRLRAIMSN